MLGKLWRRFFHRRENADPGKVTLMMKDGTVVLPPSGTEMDEKFRYLTENLIPGVGNPPDGDAGEG